MSLEPATSGSEADDLSPPLTIRLLRCCGHGSLWAVMSALMLILLLGGGAVLAVGAYWFFRPRDPEREVYYHFLCPSCSRKLRYRARKAGKPGQCPRCRTRLTFPATPIELRKEETNSGRYNQSR